MIMTIGSWKCSQMSWIFCEVNLMERAGHIQCWKIFALPSWSKTVSSLVSGNLSFTTFLFNCLKSTTNLHFSLPFSLFIGTTSNGELYALFESTVISFWINLSTYSLIFAYYVCGSRKFFMCTGRLSVTFKCWV